MNIIHIVPEVHPFSNYSSLAATTGSLPRKMAQMGHKVTVISPFYSFVDKEKYNIVPMDLKTWVDVGFTVYEFELFKVVYKDITYIFFKKEELFSRIGIYGSGTFDYADNDIRFGTFMQAAMNYIRYHNIPVDILHCHDWSTALIPVYKKLHHNELPCKTVFTVHSIENLGVFNKFSIESLNLPWDIYNIDNIEYYDNISFLKGGIVFSDSVTTISPSFAKELTSPEYGLGLDRLFENHTEKLVGILNGISYKRWNPEADHLIPATFSINDLAGKAECKKAISKSFGLNPDYPLVSFVSKLLPARGIELIIDAAREFDKLDVNLIIMGHNNPNYTGAFQDIKDNVKNVRLVFGNYSDTCHGVYAASDIVLVPSLYEPCGVSSFIGMRFGAIPVVRNTGGLKDCIADAVKDGVGFVFEDFSVESMMEAINKAAKICRSEKRSETVNKLMGYDNSWLKPTQKYLDLYKSLVEG